jgi:hypothetical protein
MKKLVILASLSTGNGNVGATGLSAYQIWLMQPGNAGKTLVEFFDSLKGDKGDPGDSVFKTWQSLPGNSTRDVLAFIEEMRGATGASAYDLWLQVEGNEGKSEEDFFESLKGNRGDTGEVGASFFETWKLLPENEGKTFEDLVSELKGEKGDPGDKGEKGEKGDQGDQGFTGLDGKSAYQVWMEAGNIGTEADFIASLKGVKGEKGDQGNQGLQGEKGDQGNPGFTGLEGKSAYQVWMEAGNVGSEADFIASLKGIKGEKGDQGEQGLQGNTGESAYKTVPDLSSETAALYDEATLAYYPTGKVYFGTTYKYFVIRTIGTVKCFVPLGITFIGTDDNGINVFDPATEQYILIRTWETLIGPPGKSAFQLWLDAGNEGSEADYLASLKGKDGENGKDGKDGASGQSAYELWKAQTGNEEKTLEDYWKFLANESGGFAFNLALDTDTSVLFSSPKSMTITSLTLLNAASVSYRINEGAAEAVDPGAVSIAVAANDLVTFTIVYASGKNQAILTIKGNY